MTIRDPKKAPESTTGPSDPIRDSAQQIWQAGLGAFTRAQAEGSRAFEALVKEGVELQRKTQAAAERRLAEATDKMAGLATDISSKAGGSWDKLESIFEQRVAKAMGRLDVPTSNDIAALNARLDALAKAVEALAAKDPVAPGAATRPAARKPRAKPN